MQVFLAFGIEGVGLELLWLYSRFFPAKGPRLPRSWSRRLILLSHHHLLLGLSHYYLLKHIGVHILSIDELLHLLLWFLRRSCLPTFGPLPFFWFLPKLRLHVVLFPFHLLFHLLLHLLLLKKLLELHLLLFSHFYHLFLLLLFFHFLFTSNYLIHVLSILLLSLFHYHFFALDVLYAVFLLFETPSLQIFLQELLGEGELVWVLFILLL